MSLTKQYIYTGPNGVACIIRPSREWFASMMAETTQEVERTRIVIQEVAEVQVVEVDGEMQEVPVMVEKEVEEVYTDYERVPGLTEDECWQIILERKEAEEGPLADLTEVPLGSLEKDRTFRDAWRVKNGAVETDMPTAVEIAKVDVRSARTPVFNQLDGDEYKATRRNDTTALADVQAKKQTVADATDDKRITEAATEEDLKAGMEAVIQDVEALL